MPCPPNIRTIVPPTKSPSDLRDRGDARTRNRTYHRPGPPSAAPGGRRRVPALFFALALIRSSSSASPGEEVAPIPGSQDVLTTIVIDGKATRVRLLKFHKDGTAQALAKVRDYESTAFEEGQRLFTDPYAHAMYPHKGIRKFYRTHDFEYMMGWKDMKGVKESLMIRTKWMDDQVLSATKEGKAKQLIILGAGYDTRPYRLDLQVPKVSFKTFEVDQPDVQKNKINNLRYLIEEKGADEIAELIDSKRVDFVPVDFNAESVDEKLREHEGFESGQHSVIMLEGVTQYIPKESTADTLKRLRTVVSPGSTLLITYSPAEWVANVHNSKKPVAMRKLLHSAKIVGEPWISGWTPEEFAAFLKDMGYLVMSDTTAENYNDMYMGAVGRRLDTVLNMERFVVAEVL